MKKKVNRKRERSGGVKWKKHSETRRKWKVNVLSENSESFTRYRFSELTRVQCFSSSTQILTLSVEKKCIYVAYHSFIYRYLNQPDWSYSELLWTDVNQTKSLQEFIDLFCIQWLSAFAFLVHPSNRFSFWRASFVKCITTFMCVLFQFCKNSH